MVLPFLIGVALTVTLLGLAWITGLYVVFAFEHGGVREVIINSMIAVLFLTLAILGYVWSLYIVAFGLILHGVFDIIYVVSPTNPAPDWWGPLCLSIDAILGLFLIASIKMGYVDNQK